MDLKLAEYTWTEYQIVITQLDTFANLCLFNAALRCQLRSYFNLDPLWPAHLPSPHLIVKIIFDPLGTFSWELSKITFLMLFTCQDFLSDLKIKHSRLGSQEKNRLDENKSFLRGMQMQRSLVSEKV